MIKALQEKLATIKEDLQCIDDHLKRDLRVTRFNNSSGNRLLVDNIEKMEDDKIYAEWLDNQQKERELEKQRKLMTEQDNTASLDLKESLFFEIKKILNQQALGQFKGGSSQGVNSYFERMQRSKADILEIHNTIGKSHFKELQGSKINKKPVQMHP